MTIKEFRDYPDTSTPINSGNLNDNFKEIKSAFNNQVAFGWYKTGISPTFTFVSYDSTTYTGVVNSNLDLTSYLSVGMKIKFTQNSTIKYAFITAITSTQLTLFLGTDYSINSSAISNTYYSMLKSPFGFPMSEDKWSIIKTLDSLLANATLNAWYLVNATHKITLPIGQWRFKVKTTSQLQLSELGYTVIKNTISTTTNSETDSNYTQTVQLNSNGMALATNNYMIDEIKTITSKTTFYILLYLSSNGTPQANSCGYLEKIKFRAVCAYL